MASRVNVKPRSRKHLSDVTQTEFVAQPLENSEQDNVDRKFKVAEWRASSFIKGTATVRAEERGRAEFGFLCSLLRRSYHTRGTVHQPILLVQLSFYQMSIPEVSLLCQDVV